MLGFCLFLPTGTPHALSFFQMGIKDSFSPFIPIQPTPKTTLQNLQILNYPIHSQLMIVLPPTDCTMNFLLYAPF